MRLFLIISLILFLYLIIPKGREDKIVVTGAFAFYETMLRIAKEFHKETNTKVEVIPAGSGKAIIDVKTGLADVGMVSRDIKKEELGEGITYVKVATDAVVVIGNKNIKKELGKDEIEKIFFERTSLGFNPYVRGEFSGSKKVFADHFGRKVWNIKGIGVFGEPTVVSMVQKDEKGIGFVNIAYTISPKTKEIYDSIKIVYKPIKRNEYLVFRKDNEKAIKFIKFILQKKGQEIIEKEKINFPLEENEREEILKNLEKLEEEKR